MQQRSASLGDSSPMRQLALAASLVLLSGCGGGGGGVVPPTPLTVDLAPLAAQCGTTVGGTTFSTASDPSAGDTPANTEQRGFFSFPHGLIPGGVTIQLAQLQITQTTVTGTPYVDFPSLVLDHVDLLGALTEADHAATALSSAFATLPHDATQNVLRTVTVTSQLLDDIANTRGISSFRLRFVNAPNTDSGADNARFELDAPGTAANLHIVYLP